MRGITAVVLGVLLITLSGCSAFAQTVIQIQETIQGTIQSVDCQTYTMALTGSGGSVNAVPGTASTTVFVNGAPIGFCTLQQYVGNYAIASVAAVGNQLVAGRIDVWLAIAPSPPPSPPSYYYPYPPYYPSPYPGNYYGPPFMPSPGIEILVGPKGR